MDTELQERVNARLFGGVLITSEIRMYLNASAEWKNAKISAFHGSDDLIEIRHEKNEYLGQFLKNHLVPLSEISKFEIGVVEKVLKYCPRLPKTSCHFYIFSQLFIH